MAYPTNLLQPDEEVVLELNPHWKYLFWPTLILVLSIIGGLFVLNQERVVQVPLGLVVLIALGWFIKRFMTHSETNMPFKSGIVSNQLPAHKNGYRNKGRLSTMKSAKYSILKGILMTPARYNSSKKL